jgi:Terminase large subunit, T4likevirus-type, N-terminal
MDPQQLLAFALDPGRILAAQGIDPDPWQQELLLSRAARVLLNCCRGAGKSRVTSALALHTALFHRDAQARPAPALVLLISRAQRQAQELYRYVRQAYNAIGRPFGAIKETETQLELGNGSRVVSLPGKEATIRSYQGCHLLVLDEGSRIPDDLFASVTPMVSVSGGRIVGLSTPFGQRGWFWREWHDDAAAWQRFRIPWPRCPRHDAAFIEEERRRFGDSWVAQEYECSFTALEGLVYPEFEQTLTICHRLPHPGDKPLGGIDWGWHNPFAALWGALDRDDVLHINQERYLRQVPLHEHAKALPRGHLWYADPAGRTEIEEFRAFGHKVLRGYNDIRLGIQAVTARLRTGRLVVCSAGCPNLVQEARLYRYPTPAERAICGELPVDEHNHALAALRYLVSRIDHRQIARQRGGMKHEAVPTQDLARDRRGRPPGDDRTPEGNAGGALPPRLADPRRLEELGNVQEQRMS